MHILFEMPTNKWVQTFQGFDRDDLIITLNRTCRYMESYYNEPCTARECTQFEWSEHLRKCKEYSRQRDYEQFTYVI